MARCQLQPQLDERSPQPSTSGYSLLEVIDNEVPGPSAPWVDPGTPNILCCKRKREWSDESEEEPEEETEKERAPEPEETWVLDTLCGLKMKLKRRQVSPALPKNYEAFNTLLGPGSPWFLCRKRKREWSDESEEEPEEETEKERAPEPEETWVLETLQGLKMKLKRRRVSPVLPEHHQAFNRLLEDPVVKRFLAWDKDLRASDKPNRLAILVFPGLVSPLLPNACHSTLRLCFLSGVLHACGSEGNHRFLDVSVQQGPPEEGMALCRVGASPELRTVSRPPLWEADLSRRSLLVVPLSSSLISAPSYLANDMEEDDEGPKQAIFYFLYGKNRSQRPLFQKLRFQFFCSMHCRAWVSLEELEEIQAYDPEHWVWARNRALLS
ncbi:speedy protein E4-like [Cebus imitator]|uniref:speedy protein E4-like n=1 Tax=Cebus imitator TaxID=2715852 RepID=UPI001898878E|nr:speedy protein E4-like [Cebus imitator]